MAALICEEKVSSDVENSLNKDKLSELEGATAIDYEIKSDAVLDEIAAKVGALDLKNESEFDQPEESHSKYMETIKKQGETINTLVRQLRIMFDEYQEVNQEREYYEDLNDALIRCLELSEGKVKIESEDDDEEENIANLVSPEDAPQETIISVTKDDETIDETQNETTTITTEQNSESTQTDQRKMSNKELVCLNQVLLREIYELRYQIQAIHETIQEQESDFDTATDDEDHVCLHCDGVKAEASCEDEEESDIDTSTDDNNHICHNRSGTQDDQAICNTDAMKTSDEEHNDEYQHVEESIKIKDESDTE